MYNLGLAFLSHFDQSANPIDNDAAISHFRYVAISSTGSPSFRLRTALQWARLATKVHDSSAFHGYSVAISHLPQIAWLGQTISVRYTELISVSHITSKAVAIAIDAERYDTALEWLEQGRSIVWTQLLNLRIPFDALRELDASLADDLTRVARALEHAGSMNVGPQYRSTESDQQFSMEQVAQHQRRLAKEWETLVERARAIPGFEDFLQPKKLPKLFSAAKAGPVVVININEHHCDALVLIAGLDEVMHIPLDSFSYKKAQELHRSLDHLLFRARNTRAMKLFMSTTNIGFPRILSDLWSYVVKPVLDGLAFPVSYLSFNRILITNIIFLKVSRAADPPRIWWCATGPLTFLPIHAAGIYDQTASGLNISDYVVSSYTPTLNTLINATELHNSETHQGFRGLLAVIQPNTPGQIPLPNTTVELMHIQRRARNFDVHQLEGPMASVESVVSGMEMHSWVHLACHAVQGTCEPTRSAFCLYDGRLELSTIITKSFPYATFAFLSACETATGTETIPDEAIHLAAGLMSAGYHSVIATMWSITDRDAPVIADHVYSDLFSDTQAEPDSTRAALALYHGVKALHEQVVGDSAFLSWVPFIHVGI